jgi:hypothetical protein
VVSSVITIGIDDALKQIESERGSTLVPRTPISATGAFADFQDPEGNIMGLWETTRFGCPLAVLLVVVGGSWMARTGLSYEELIDYRPVVVEPANFDTF